MDVHTKNAYRANKPPGINANKVYINPYFNSCLITNTNKVLRESTSMHFNPRFSNSIPHSNINNSKAKIFINPNFVKSVQGHTSNEYFNNVTHNSYNNMNNLLESIVQPNLPLLNVKKSRYSLVRHGINQVIENVKEKPSNTIKISKYKSVPITDIKNKLMKQHNTIKTCQSARNFKILQSSKNLSQFGQSKKSINRYKYVKCKPPTASFDGCKRDVNAKTSIAVIKKNYKLKIKDAKKVFKKNNIPCPLFKKFGKCIRSAHGNCEFLHDKKHVTLCRKFLKGNCFDNDCLLSHDLTTKKMPTCYFYLKGMCTKEDCPYVHIKLNEGTKICSDFLKGYCEKGKKCTNRHVTVASDTKTQFCYKNKENDKVKAKKKSICENKPTDDQNHFNATNFKEQKRIITESRYYEDQGNWTNDISDISEVIKPIRCKLGSLPSFIQLHD